MRFLLSVLFSLYTLHSIAQYAPAAGQAGSTAIHMDSSIIVAWANQCTFTRGWQNISDQSLGKTSVGSQSSAIGKADNNVLSLGDGGTAIMQFAQAITNGPGPDFAVFENAFDDYFLELAFVEVSSDGLNYIRFPAHSLTQTTTQVGGFGQLQTEKINNLAGKYKVAYGTPFDLEELKDSIGLDITHITHIRIIDVVGSINDAYASYDTAGNKINDPFPTPFPSSGFDLDAVAVLNTATSLSTLNEAFKLNIFPNPSSGIIHIQCPIESTIQIVSANGQILLNQHLQGGMSTLNLDILNKGLYIIRVQSSKGIIVRQVVKN